VSIQPGTYKLGPGNGTLSVRTGRAGAAAKAGHDLLLHVTVWQATLEVGEGPAQTSIVLAADSTSLRVREGTGGMQALGADDMANIEETIDEEILKREEIEFRSTAVQASGDGRLSVEGELTLLGSARPIEFELTVDDGKLRGGAVLTQSDWGITPYSALFGALQVTDEVNVTIDVSLPSTVSVWMSISELRPRELKPALLELEEISRATVEAQYRLYEGYVSTRNEILRQLAAADHSGASQVESELRVLRVELSFAIGGIKSHEAYLEHLGGDGGDPTGAVAELIRRDFGSAEAWHADLKATAMAARGWAWTAYDWDEGRLVNYLGDAQNAFPVWNATPLVALDVNEHAYYLDFKTDRGAYIDAFFANLDWGVVNAWVSRFRIPLK
jgi:superoxide dismutase, Fe-Mn family